MTNVLKQISARLNKPVLAADSSVFVTVLADNSVSELVVGKDCTRLTKQYQKYGVSCHALPGQRDVNNAPVFAVIGPSKAKVEAALRAYSELGPDETLGTTSIVRCPIA